MKGGYKSLLCILCTVLPSELLLSNWKMATKIKEFVLLTRKLISIKCLGISLFFLNERTKILSIQLTLFKLITSYVNFGLIN